MKAKAATRKKANAPAATPIDRSKLPIADPPFRGKVGKTYQDSKGEWPQPPKVQQSRITRA
jgi:hypothetical protein